MRPLTGITSILPLLLLVHVYAKSIRKPEYRVEHENQPLLLENAKLDCINKLNNFSVSTRNRSKLFCPSTWDGVVCWLGEFQPGTTVSQPCPNYIDKFIRKGKIYKTCNDDGTWFRKVNVTKPWTDFTECRKSSSTEPVLSIVVAISNIGFVISITSVILGILILRFFKNLHCDRNTIHINLFLACLLRSLSSLFSQLQTNNETNTWCKIVMTLHNYLIMANFTWVFVEALYLHNVLTLHTFKETSGLVFLYILIGWGLPLIAISIWIILRLIYDNTYCWDAGDSEITLDMWVLFAYPVILLIQNIIFFIKLIVILHAKMITHQLSATQNKFRKLAKSILVLMVVFGLYQLIFVPLDLIENMYNNEVSFQIKMCSEYLLNSAQGFMLAMMFCFCNSEVLKEVKRKFQNHRNTRSLHTTEDIKIRDNSCRKRRGNQDSMKQTEHQVTCQFSISEDVDNN